MENLNFSIIVPVYMNEKSLPDLASDIRSFCERNPNTEAVFVIDGSPDQSYEVLRRLLPQAGFSSQLVLLSRNFGSFASIRAGMSVARGEALAVIAADRQEPIEVLDHFLRELDSEDCDIVFGKRRNRSDPWFTRATAALFWNVYRQFSGQEIPDGGVDIFACKRKVSKELLSLGESNSSLLGLLFWVGFKRRFVEYDRRERQHGKSAWTMAKKIKYMRDSLFAFSDFPVRLLTWIGGISLATAALLGTVVIIAKLSGQLTVPGYSALFVAIVFFGGINCFGLGLLGEYIFRTFENTKKRPAYFIKQCTVFP